MKIWAKLGGWLGWDFQYLVHGFRLSTINFLFMKQHKHLISLLVTHLSTRKFPGFTTFFEGQKMNGWFPKYVILILSFFPAARQSAEQISREADACSSSQLCWLSNSPRHSATSQVHSATWAGVKKSLLKPNEYKVFILIPARCLLPKKGLFTRKLQCLPAPDSCSSHAAFFSLTHPFAAGNRLALDWFLEHLGSQSIKSALLNVKLVFFVNTIIM